ncbi:hypothetical protein B0H21DRAFT_161184 [Amylocystis lapponica]|nr:hypothetical protein B0H21DRAFT_161184 [Amylocystis lapponica]
MKTYTIRVLAAEAQVTTNISGLLTRDGTIHLVVWLIINILGAVFSEFALIDSAIVNIMQTISPILVSHFMLNLREIYLSDSDDTSLVGSISFTSRLAGNLGAPLDGELGHIDLEDDDLPSVPEPLFSHNPLAEGLVPNLDATTRLPSIRDDVDGSANNIASGSQV